MVTLASRWSSSLSLLASGLAILPCAWLTVGRRTSHGILPRETWCGRQSWPWWAGSLLPTP